LLIQNNLQTQYVFDRFYVVLTKAILCPRSNDINNVSGEVLNSLHRQVKTHISVYSTGYKDEKDHSQWSLKSYLTGIYHKSLKLTGGICG
jgi:hypothetical protein